jgi:hypothetical protein
MVGAALLDVARSDPPSWIVLVHGAAQGADRIAAAWAAEWGWLSEPHRPDYRAHGYGAPRVRNRAMVSAGADVCLAFLDLCRRTRCRQSGPHTSHGATRTAGWADAAGIPVRRHYTTEARP